MVRCATVVPLAEAGCNACVRFESGPTDSTDFLSRGILATLIRFLGMERRQAKIKETNLQREISLLQYSWKAEYAEHFD